VVFPDDQQLVSQSRAGDTRAFDELVLRYQDRLFHSMQSILKSDEDTLDIVQDAFVRAFHKLDTFRGDSAFYSWLYRIAANLAFSHLRKSKSRGPVTSVDTLVESGLAPADASIIDRPLDAVVRQEHQQIVRDTLAELPEDFRIVLVMKEFDGYSYEHISESIGVPIGTVRSRIHRARADLAERLRRRLAEPGQAGSSDR
tara:strand:+ start:3438 stop:4037 length:600 start_codon:yes stop_codon:yes gene_type:complete